MHFVSLAETFLEASTSPPMVVFAPSVKTISVAPCVRVRLLYRVAPEFIALPFQR